MGCIPKITPEYEQRMLDVLEVYERKYDSKNPVVCIDEKSKQLLKETREPIGTKPGKVAKTDYEYKRNDTCNIFVAVEPKGNKRTIRVTRHRAGKDWASFIKYLLTHVYKRIHKLVLVEDNLYQHAMVEVLADHGVNVKGLKSVSSKYSRLMTAGMLFEQGKVLFTADGACTPIIRQVLGLGIEKHDDLCDAMTIALNYINTKVKRTILMAPLGPGSENENTIYTIHYED